MPASMINAPTGGNPNVIGRSMATVATVPIPGSTPTKVPTSAPRRQNPMLYGCAATENPSARLARSSLMAALFCQYQGQSWNGNCSRWTKRTTQNVVIAVAAIRLSTQRISVEAKIEIMKAANVEGINPNGGIVAN